MTHTTENSKDTTICKECGNEYNLKERNIVFGESVLLTGFCSAQCYTKHYLPTENSKEVLPAKLTLLVTGSGKRTDELSSELLLRTDSSTLHFDKNSEFGKLAHTLIDRYNERQEILKNTLNLIESNKELVEALEEYLYISGYKYQNSPAFNKAKTALENAKNLLP